MDIRGLALLPVRVTVAATQATLALGQLASPQGPILREGGYGTRLAQIFGEGGLLEQLNRILADERGPIGLANTLADLTADDRPVGKALARDGLLDRMADEEGPFVRLLEAGGPLDRALGEDGPLYRFLAPGGPLDRLLAEEGASTASSPRVACSTSCLPRRESWRSCWLPEELDQLIDLGATFDAIVPRLEALGNAIPNLNSAVNILSGAVEPLSVLGSVARWPPTIACAGPGQRLDSTTQQRCSPGSSRQSRSSGPTSSTTAWISARFMPHTISVWLAERVWNGQLARITDASSRGS